MYSDKSSRIQLWTGLLEVKPLPDADILLTASGAFVRIVTWALDADEFLIKAKKIADHLRLVLVGIQNPEPLLHSAVRDDDEVKELQGRAEANRDAILYGTFHTWTDVTG
jgi:hypothetical protein